MNASRNPSQFEVGEKVRVVNPEHRDYGKSGAIVKLAGIENDHSGKARATILTDAGYIVVSLGNLEKSK